MSGVLLPVGGRTQTGRDDARQGADPSKLLCGNRPVTLEHWTATTGDYRQSDRSEVVDDVTPA